MNIGTKAFGDWFLTMRGGLDHLLADAVVKGKGKSPDRDPTDEERKARRILLALSWLTVESKAGAPEALFVATGEDLPRVREEKVLPALEGILIRRGLDEKEIVAWKSDCYAPLSAAIREDAVWVNRSKAFDEICIKQDKQQAREDARKLVWHLFTDKYLELPNSIGQKQQNLTDEQAVSVRVQQRESLKASGAGAGKRTRVLFSHIFGKSESFGRLKHSLKLKEYWRSYLMQVTRSLGIPVNNLYAAPIGKSPTEFHRAMLFEAASRVAQTWTKQKQQEVDRNNRMLSDEALRLLESNEQYSHALSLLDEYCQERAREIASTDEYQINSRAIAGWDRVVEAWFRIDCSDPAMVVDRRIDEAKRLINDNPDKKLGDINLFSRLADQRYEPVWKHNHEKAPEILKTYAIGWKARSDSARLKVAAYRHPDPYFHPVFCRFGKSRPQIKFKRLDMDCSGDTREIEMRLWSGCESNISLAEDISLLAISQRFDEEIGSITANDGNNDIANQVPEVSRRSRFGRAAVKLGGNSTCRVAHVFDETTQKSNSGFNDDGDDSQDTPEKPSWGGMLHADRSYLAQIGGMELKNPKKALRAKIRTRWLMTVSLKLQQQGPWCDFVCNSGDKEPFKRTNGNGDEYISFSWPHERANRVRKNKSRLVLCRLPGLRILSVDLGHRHAAACAVWETLSAEQMNAQCDGAKQERPSADDLFVHLKRFRLDKKGNPIQTREIYRRIGADQLPDGTRHPAPWARLERQFLIKLQGEDREARAASNEEIWEVHQMEVTLGVAVPYIDRLVNNRWSNPTRKQKVRLNELVQLGWKPADPEDSLDEIETDNMFFHRVSISVDELMQSAADTLRRALGRHGRRARIAFAFTSDYKSMPGDRKYYFTKNEDASVDDDSSTRRNKHIEYIANMLLLWHGLASTQGWQDVWAKELWDERIAKLDGYKHLEGSDDRVSKAESWSIRKGNAELLKSVAQRILDDEGLRQELHKAWKEKWTNDDLEWPGRLRWFREWIMPRGKALRNDPTIRNVGGLSLTRLTTIREFRRKIQVGYFTRLRPDDPPDMIKEHFGQKTLNTLERLQEQRVKQLASRIVEASLGIGRETSLGGRTDVKRPRESVFEPCHAVVIESLARYRPDEMRTRRENRALMSWSSSRVKKYLAESCELHGLHLREVSASYTSLQDSRTGAPGIRCQEMSVKEFTCSRFWQREVAVARQKKGEGKGGDARDRYLYELAEACLNKRLDERVRIPRKGGEIFVSAHSDSPSAAGIQADLNAAANIGLRALLDPDWPGRWWYVLCKANDFKPAADEVKGSTVIDIKKSLRSPKRKEPKTSRGLKEKVNLFRDVSSAPVTAQNGEWQTYAEYWNRVQNRVIENLR